MNTALPQTGVSGRSCGQRCSEPYPGELQLDHSGITGLALSTLMLTVGVVPNRTQDPGFIAVTKRVVEQATSLLKGRLGYAEKNEACMPALIRLLVLLQGLVEKPLDIMGESRNILLAAGSLQPCAGRCGRSTIGGWPWNSSVSALRGQLLKEAKLRVTALASCAMRVEVFKDGRVTSVIELTPNAFTPEAGLAEISWWMMEFCRLVMFKLIMKDQRMKLLVQGMVEEAAERHPEEIDPEKIRERCGKPIKRLAIAGLQLDGTPQHWAEFYNKLSICRQH